MEKVPSISNIRTDIEENSIDFEFDNGSFVVIEVYTKDDTDKVRFEWFCPNKGYFTEDLGAESLGLGIDAIFWLNEYYRVKNGDLDINEFGIVKDISGLSEP